MRNWFYDLFGFFHKPLLLQTHICNKWAVALYGHMLIQEPNRTNVAMHLPY